MHRHRSYISLVAIFGLLMLASAFAFKQPVSSANADLQPAGHHKVHFTAASIPFYLAEVKHQNSNSGANSVAFSIDANAFGPKKSAESRVSQSRTDDCKPQSLWLLHRSILI